MDAQARQLIPSGIEPVDKLMGGLDRGDLYLVHGDASGKRLFGIKFLIEGLKRGERAALIVRSSAEDAVNRFSRVGYHCLKDIYSGRLVIIENSEETIKKIARQVELTPLLREFEWLLGATSPGRIVFDPVTDIVLTEHGDLESRVAQFLRWTRSLGATALLIANGEDHDIVQLLKNDVTESFRFDVREEPERATRSFAFEKTLTIPEHAIEVDPSRGIFLLRQAPDAVQTPTPPRFVTSSTSPDFRLLDIETPLQFAHAREVDDESATAAEEAINQNLLAPDPLNLDLASIEDALDRLVDLSSAASSADSLPLAAHARKESDRSSARSHQERDAGDEGFDLATELFGELADVPCAGDLEPSTATNSTDLSSSLESSPLSSFLGGQQSMGVNGESAGRGEELYKPPVARRRRASDAKIAANTTATDSAVFVPARPKRPAESKQSIDEPVRRTTAPEEFKVLVINDDPEFAELIARALSDFSVERVHDGMSGLAKLINFKPDLVILDVDLPVIDGFKVLAHIRESLDVPVIIVSGALMTSSNRVLSTELEELRHKARNLIARYRGIDSSAIDTPPGQPIPASEHYIPTLASDDTSLTPYHDFVAEAEKRVNEVMYNGSAISIVGCRVPQMTTVHGDIVQSRLREVVREVVRETDLTSTNAPGDIVVLLADAGASGARAFARRLRATVTEQLHQEPSLWIRSFPELEEVAEVAAGGIHSFYRPRRRASDA